MNPDIPGIAEPMRFLVLGAGAVGLSVTAKLSTVCPVYAVCRERHARAIAARGFQLSGRWGEGIYHFPAGEGIPEKALFDVVIVTSKAVDTARIGEQFSPFLAGAEVVSLQNGIGNEEILSRYSDRIIGGTIITGFEWRGDAAVHVTVEAGPVKLGRFPSGLDSSVEALVSLFVEAGIRAEGSSSIQSDLWAKTIYNCALNPLGAIMEVPYGTLAREEAWGIVESVVQEVYPLLEREGIALPWPTAKAYLQYLKTFQLPATAEHRSSMLQDLVRGRRTEIDFLNGAVAARSLSRGIHAPVNEVLTALIHFKEHLREGEQ
jgi:2-dehydropantoate 2-reductase